MKQIRNSNSLDDPPANPSHEKIEPIRDTTDKPIEAPVNQESNDKSGTAHIDEIESIGQEARDRISRIIKITDRAEASKKKVITDAAKKLEDKIPTNTIALKLTSLLHGLVSERYIRECLEDKYKQEYRALNAKKQVSEKLAELAPLEQQFTSDNMIEEKDGMVLVHHAYPFTTRSDVLEAIETMDKSTHDKAGTESESESGRISKGSNVTFYADTSKLSHKKNEEVHIFSLPWRKLNDYMQSILLLHETMHRVPFYIVIDKKTRKPITAGFGSTR